MTNPPQGTGNSTVNVVQQFGCTEAPAASADTFRPFFGSYADANDATESNNTVKINRGFTFANLWCNVTTNADTGVVLGMRDDGTTVDPQVSIGSGTGEFENTSDTSVVASGSKCCFIVDGSGSSKTVKSMIVEARY